MKALRLAVVAFVGIVIALWWAVMPPRFAPPQGGPIGVQQRLQCPPGSVLDGKLCNCPEGSAWTGSACRVRWAAPEDAASAPALAAGDGVVVYPVGKPVTQEQGR